jgi:sodium transport system ATP-binding protein
MIRADQLTKRFRSGGRDVLAVDSVSFEISPGEAYGLLGPNGAGKTTTLRMVLGLIPPDSGYAEVAGYRTTESPRDVKRQIGFVSASSGVYPWLTPRETLLYFADLYGLTSQRAHQRAELLAELFGLTPFYRQRCSTLSTGQRQRLALARALIHDPPVVLLDEPTRGLDIMGTQVVFEYVRRVCAEGKAVILTTHRLDEAQRLCERFGLIHQGRLVREGTLEQLRQETGCDNLAEMFIALAPILPLSEPLHS